MSVPTRTPCDGGDAAGPAGRLAPCLRKTLDGALLLDGATGQILDANDAYCALVGLSLEQLRKRRLGDLEVASARGEAERCLETVRRDGACRCRCVHRHADGHALSVEVSASLAGDQVLTLVRDRTDDERLQAALEASEARFRRSFDHATVGKALTLPDGRLERVNDALCQLLGYSRAELEAKSFAEITHPDDRGKSAEAVRRTLAGESDMLRFEKRYLTKDGGVVWADVNAVLLRDAGGAPLHFVTHIVDITQRKRLEEKNRRVQAELVAIYQHAPMMLFLLDPERRVRKANQAAVDFAGRDVDEMASQRVGEALRCIHALDDPRGCGFGPDCQDCVLRRTVLDSIQRGAVHRNLEIVLSRGGPGCVTERPVVFSSVPIALDGKTRILISIEDRTAQKQLEDQLRQAQRLESVGRLAGGIAHDFNNLLSVILAGTELAVGSLSPISSATRDLEEVRRAAERAASLTGQLLAFSRRQALQPRLFDLNVLLRDLEAMLRRLLPETIQLELRLTAAAVRVKADWGQVEQILMNLAVNARDAMPAGGTIAIETGEEELDAAAGRGVFAVRPGRYVRLVVADTGSGMSEATRSHAFEPFFTTRPKGQGTGLGLSTVFGIVKQHGGYVWLDSEPGEGTRCRIYLPAVTADERATKPPGRPLLPEPRGQETILVVEDEAAVRALVQRVLIRQGYRVLGASDGLEAQTVARNHPGRIALLLTDVIMPGCDGPTCARALEKEQPDLRVLFMSGYADVALGERGIVPEEVRFLTKPFTIASLSQAVRSALDAPAPA